MDLEFHEAANLFPLMEGQAFEELKADIDAHGQQQPCWTYEGKLLDGRNRYRACRELGIEPIILNVEENYGGEVPDPVTFVLSANLCRRHLTLEQKREVIAAVLKADPTRSDRQTAKKVGADHKTVGSVRKELEGRGEIPHVEVREDTAGRQQPTRREAAPAPAEPEPSASVAPELTQAWRRGDLSDEEARKLARQSIDEQQKIAAEANARHSWLSGFADILRWVETFVGMSHDDLVWYNKPGSPGHFGHDITPQRIAAAIANLDRVSRVVFGGPGESAPIVYFPIGSTVEGLPDLTPGQALDLVRQVLRAKVVSEGAAAADRGSQRVRADLERVARDLDAAVKLLLEAERKALGRHEPWHA